MTNYEFNQRSFARHNQTTHCRIIELFIYLNKQKKGAEIMSDFNFFTITFSTINRHHINWAVCNHWIFDGFIIYCWGRSQQLVKSRLFFPFEVFWCTKSRFHKGALRAIMHQGCTLEDSVFFVQHIYHSIRSWNNYKKKRKSFKKCIQEKGSVKAKMNNAQLMCIII